MAFTKIYKKVTIFLCALFLTSSNGIGVYAVSNKDETHLIPHNLQKKTNGADIKITQSTDNADDGLDININSINLEKGYYTSYIYENLNTDWSNYTMIAFNVDNKSEGALRLNLTVQQTNGTSLLVKDDKAIMIKGENNEVMQRAQLSYGTIELAKGFKGTIYIPFSSLGDQGEKSNSKKFNIANISSWGVIIVSAENEEKSFKLSRFLLTKDLEKLSNDINVKFIGDTQVQIPVVGESIAKYKADIYDSNGRLQDKSVKYKLENAVEGVSISEDGRLTVAEDVNPQKIKVCAIIDGNLSEVKEVELIKSWTLSVKEVDGTSKSVPKPNEVKKVVGGKYSFLLDEKILSIIRTIFIVLIIAWGGLFFSWVRKDNKRKNM